MGSARGLLQKESSYRYDSYYLWKTSEELDIQLALLYNIMNLSLNLMWYPFNNKVGAKLCFFAAAVCLSVATGEDGNIRWRQAHMRIHLK